MVQTCYCIWKAKLEWPIWCCSDWMLLNFDVGISGAVRDGFQAHLNRVTYLHFNMYSLVSFCIVFCYIGFVWLVKAYVRTMSFESAFCGASHLFINIHLRTFTWNMVMPRIFHPWSSYSSFDMLILFSAGHSLLLLLRLIACVVLQPYQLDRLFISEVVVFGVVLRGSPLS